MLLQEIFFFLRVNKKQVRQHRFLLFTVFLSLWGDLFHCLLLCLLMCSRNCQLSYLSIQPKVLMQEHKEITGTNCLEKRKLKTTVLIPKQIRKQDFLYTEYPILTKSNRKNSARLPVLFPSVLLILKMLQGMNVLQILALRYKQLSKCKQQNTIFFFPWRWKITWKILLHCVQNISKAFVHFSVPRQCSENDANHH